MRDTIHLPIIGISLILSLASARAADGVDAGAPLVDIPAGDEGGHRLSAYDTSDGAPRPFNLASAFDRIGQPRHERLPPAV